MFETQTMCCRAPYEYDKRSIRITCLACGGSVGDLYGMRTPCHGTIPRVSNVAYESLICGVVGCESVWSIASGMLLNMDPEWAKREGIDEYV